MSSNLPTDPAEVIAFVNARAEVWVENQPLIGSTPAEVAAVEAALAAARAAQIAAVEARNAAQAATRRYYELTRDLRSTARVVVENAKSRAKATGDASIYSRASLNPPKSRSRQAPLPGMAKNLSLVVERSGHVLLSWECNNPRGLHGVVYEVRRKVMEASERNGKRVIRWTAGEVVGLVGGSKVFRDSTVPMGVGRIAYTVTAIHNGRRAQSSFETPFQFGSATPTAMAATTGITTGPMIEVKPATSSTPAASLAA